MRKIGLFIDTKDLGGAERVVVDLGAVLPRFGYEAQVLHFGNSWLSEQCEALKIPHQIVPSESDYRKKSRFFHFAQEFHRFLRKERVDLLHSHLFGPLTAGAIASRLAGCPHVGTLHDTYTISEKPSRYWYIEAAGLMGTALVAVARSMVDYFSGYSHLHRERLMTIYNGIDPEQFKLERVRDVVRRDLGLSPDDFVVINVGRLVALKAQELLIDALGLMESRVPTRILIVGEGPMAQPLQERIDRTGTGDAVKLLGKRSDVSQLLKAADCFVLPSRTEGLSCSVIEAMGAGLPCVVTDVGGNKELVRDSVNGMVIEKDDLHGLAASLDRLAEDIELRQRYGQASVERMRSHFTIDVMTENYANLYEQLLST